MCVTCSKKTFVSLTEVQSIFGLTKKDDLKSLGGTGSKNAVSSSVNKQGQQAPKMQLFEQSKVIEYCLNKFESPEKIEEYWALKRGRGDDKDDKDKGKKKEDTKKRKNRLIGSIVLLLESENWDDVILS